MHPPTAIEVDRFFAKVDWPADPDDCWLWNGSTSRGYGYIQHGKRVVRAPRLAYFWFRGAIGDGLHIDHRCDTPLCVNFTHLRAVTPRENTLRSRCPAARQARQTTCLHGHDLNAPDVYRDPRGRRRVCRVCSRQRQQQRRAR